MVSGGPSTMSFSPEKTQAEFAWPGAPVGPPAGGIASDGSALGVPGGPFTSPAKAAVALAPASAAAQAATASSGLMRIYVYPPSGWNASGEPIRRARASAITESVRSRGGGQKSVRNSTGRDHGVRRLLMNGPNEHNLRVKDIALVGVDAMLGGIDPEWREHVGRAA
jgi:hypothetical protein